MSWKGRNIIRLLLLRSNWVDWWCIYFLPSHAILRVARCRSEKRFTQTSKNIYTQEERFFRNRRPHLCYFTSLGSIECDAVFYLVLDIFHGLKTLQKRRCIWVMRYATWASWGVCVGRVYTLKLEQWRQFRVYNYVTGSTWGQTGDASVYTHV